MSAAWASATAKKRSSVAESVTVIVASLDGLTPLATQSKKRSRWRSCTAGCSVKLM